MRTKRKWHENFIKYMKFIVNHKNYLDLPNKFKGNGEILWVSPSDKVRATWWDSKKTELHCVNRAEVARKIHPKELKGLKPCQICGKELSIFYIYTNKNSLSKLNSITPKCKFAPFKENIDEIIDSLYNILGEKAFPLLKSVFNIPLNIRNEKCTIKQFIKENRKTRLSPGVMSNPPDRLDGFHTYNACCRPSEDTGRHTSNLARYSQDRRVYENWAEGNWNLSNRLMGEFNKYELEIKCPHCSNTRKMTADHIGPISLGFTHRPKFNPLCRECNSSKNNRMTLEDVHTLIQDEKDGEQVISWHSKYLWDALKNKVRSQKDALKLSKIMRLNLHRILILFSKISEVGYDEFLKKYLHPEYSFVDYKFVNFSPLTGPEKIVEKPLDSKNKQKNANRYIRIAFESLDKYKTIENRNTKIWQSLKIDEKLKDLLKSLSNNNNTRAQLTLLQILEQLASEAGVTFGTKF